MRFSFPQSIQSVLIQSEWERRFCFYFRLIFVNNFFLNVELSDRYGLFGGMFCNGSGYDFVTEKYASAFPPRPKLIKINGILI